MLPQNIIFTVYFILDLVQHPLLYKDIGIKTKLGKQQQNKNHKLLLSRPR